MPALHIVADVPDRLTCIEEGIRSLLRDRDELTAKLAKVNDLLAIEARAYADLLGEKPLPDVARLRRDLLNG